MYFLDVRRLARLGYLDFPLFDSSENFPDVPCTILSFK